MLNVHFWLLDATMLPSRFGIFKETGSLKRSLVPPLDLSTIVLGAGLSLIVLSSFLPFFLSFLSLLSSFFFLLSSSFFFLLSSFFFLLLFLLSDHPWR